ncbi:MAG: thioesterase [Ignavibacteria bacterium]
MLNSPMPTSRPFETCLSFRVTSYDVDYVGYAHNMVYLRWLEDLRIAMLAPHYALERFVREGISPIIVRTTIEYKKPLRLFDTFTGTIWVSDLLGVRWTVQHELVRDEHLVAQAEQFGVFIHLASGRPARAPAELMEKYLAIDHDRA